LQYGDFADTGAKVSEVMAQLSEEIRSSFVATLDIDINAHALCA
jgi:hypothetical protein